MARNIEKSKITLDGTGHLLETRMTCHIPSVDVARVKEGEAKLYAIVPFPGVKNGNDKVRLVIVGIGENVLFDDTKESIRELPSDIVTEIIELSYGS